MSQPDQPSDIDPRIASAARDWIVRLASGTVGADELRQFKAWRDRSPMHARAFERERVFWRQLQAVEGARHNVPAPAARAHAGRRAFLVGGVAASALAAAFAAPRLGLWWRADFSTAVGEIAEFSLPDGSVALLNTASAIAVDFRTGARRIDLLKGEAEFRVRPDPRAPFRVAALDGYSDTLGSVFSVSAWDGRATVTVSEGVVRLATDGGRQVELAAGQQAGYARGLAPDAAVSVDTGAALAWRSGKVVFDGRPFALAIAELARYVPEWTVVRQGDAGDVPVSGVFSTATALSAMRALAQTQGLALRRIPGVMIAIA